MNVLSQSVFLLVKSGIQVIELLFSQFIALLCFLYLNTQFFILLLFIGIQLVDFDFSEIFELSYLFLYHLYFIFVLLSLNENFINLLLEFVVLEL